MVKQICEQCGKEFEALGDWQKVCRDCYHKKAETAPGKTKYQKKTGTGEGETNKGNSNPSPDTVLKELRQTFDEVMAEFQPEIEAGQLTMEDIRTMTSSVFIEKNDRIWKRKRAV